MRRGGSAAHLRTLGVNQLTPPSPLDTHVGVPGMIPQLIPNFKSQLPTPTGSQNTVELGTT